jgi:hypothetical protein
VSFVAKDTVTCAPLPLGCADTSPSIDKEHIVGNLRANRPTASRDPLLRNLSAPSSAVMVMADSKGPTRSRISWPSGRCVEGNTRPPIVLVHRSLVGVRST